MADKSPKKLRTLLRETYSGLKQDGSERIMIHELIEAVTKKHPKLVEQEKDRLFRDAIGAWARQILRSDSDSLRSSQLMLPMELHHVRLPVCIPIWPKGHESGEAEWVETPDITFAQVDQEIARK